jgi:hypothetical protein
LLYLAGPFSIGDVDFFTFLIPLIACRTDDAVCQSG